MKSLSGGTRLKLFLKRYIDQGLYGAGLLWSWGFLYFFLNQSSGFLVWGISWNDFIYLVFGILISLVIVVSAKHLGELDQHRWIAPSACVLLVAGMVLTMLSSYFVSGTGWLYVISSALIGVGQGAFWIVWGELLARCEMEDAENTLLSWLPMLAVLFLLVAALEFVFAIPNELLTALLALFPIASLIAFQRATKTIGPASHQRKRIPENASGSSRTLKGVLVYFGCIFSIISFVWNVFSLQSRFSFGILIAVFALGTLVAFFVMWRLLAATRRFDFSFLIRWMLPVMVLGVTLSTFVGNYTMFLAYLCLTAIHVGFEVMAKLYFVYLAQKSPNKGIEIIGLGFIMATLGGLIGRLVENAVSAIPSGLGLTGSTLIALVLFVFVATAALGRDNVTFQLDLIDSSSRDVLDSSPDTAPACRCREIAKEYGLSPRETEVMLLLAQGRSRAYIREVLFISKGTVDAHAHSIYSKLGIRSKDALMNMVLGG
jgi:DNA-binding CsgD family transcriptional regulator